MPKRKIAIAISDWLLEDVDRWAVLSGKSRSALVEEAMAEYVTRAHNRANDEEYRQRTAAALEDMKRIAREYAEDPEAAGEPSSLELLRQLRGTADRTEPE